MIKIATLGPAGTFSDTATQRYIKTQTQACEIHYFDSIKLALNAVGDRCEYGVLPVENFSEGFISLVLDHLLDSDLSVVSEIRLAIQFSLVSQTTQLAAIRQLYVQFVAKGQCSEFIDALGGIEIETTESNMESLRCASQGNNQTAAIVPSSAVRPEDFPLVINDVNDYKNNETRFLVFTKNTAVCQKDLALEYKTSVIVMDENDHPGFLGEVLLSFSNRKINLTSIMSRPTRQTFGKYHFFIDFDGHVDDINIAQALAEIAGNCKVKLLGSYPKMIDKDVRKN
ncbi:prephenate dehydratase [Paraglaciecola sp. 25GB23A]|uniref:prephenate dehydratase n=1 Tax=Paraglaciecola sp. 25GB23A TaxID=3156068 RepID=UPI0032AFFBE9